MRAFHILILVSAATVSLAASSPDPEAESTAVEEANAEAKVDAEQTKTEEVAKAEPKLNIPTPSSSWIRVDQPSAAGEDTIAMMLHARGQGRVFVRKSTPKSAKKSTLDWLKKEMRDLEVFDHEEQGAGLTREEFSFVGWQGPKAMAGVAGVYVLGDDAYVVLATCDKDFYEKHERELQKVLAEFRAE